MNNYFSLAEKIEYGMPQGYVLGSSWCISESPETIRKLCLSTKFPYEEIGEITVFYVMVIFPFILMIPHLNPCLSYLEKGV